MRWRRWWCADCDHRFERYVIDDELGCMGCLGPLVWAMVGVICLPLSWMPAGGLGFIVGACVNTLRRRRLRRTARRARPDLPTPKICPRCDSEQVRLLEHARDALRCPDCGSERFEFRSVAVQAQDPS